jgi:hypothetical protein
MSSAASETAAPAVPRRARWALRPRLPLLAVLAMFVFGGLGHADRRVVEGEFKTGHYRLTPGWALRAVRGFLTNDDDMYHFFAYAQATFGRPYKSFFIRSRDGWQAFFARGQQEDPDGPPVVIPPRPLRPYRDFLIEYPPGALLAILSPGLLATTADGYELAFKLGMALCLWLLLAQLERLARLLGDGDAAVARLPRAFAAAVLALGIVCTHRFDGLVAVCLVGAALAATRARPAAAGFLLGVGVLIKGVPLLIVPPVAAYLYAQYGRRSAARLLAVAGATALGLFAAAWLWCGGGILDGLSYQRDRPLQVESTPSALLALVAWLRPGLVSVVYSFGSSNLDGRPVTVLGALVPLLSAAATGAAVLLVVARLWRLRGRTGADDRTRLMALVEGSVLVLAVQLTSGKVFCPQYLMWLLPFGLVAAFGAGRSVRWRWTGLALVAATQLIYPFAYAAVKSLAPWASALVLARNLGLLTWAALLWLGDHPEAATAPVPASA